MQCMSIHHRVAQEAALSLRDAEGWGGGADADAKDASPSFLRGGGVVDPSTSSAFDHGKVAPLGM